GETEEVALFRDAVERYAFMHKARRRVALARGPRVLVFGLELGTGRAEPALVETLVDRLAPLRRLARRDAPPELRDARVVERLGGAHEDVVAAVRAVELEGGEHFFQLAHDLIHVLFRLAPGVR